MPPYITRTLGDLPDAIAPDGSHVYRLAADAAASMAQFVLPPGQITAAVVHRTVAEYWYVLAGAGRLWRDHAGDAAETALAPGVAVTIPVGTRFQFRNDGADDLRILGVTTPPWPGPDEAVAVTGVWSPRNA